MQILIPMTGEGSRFKRAGYDRLKPMIKVHGVSMVEWVTRLFPGADHEISFICQSAHLDTLDYLRPELEKIAPHGRILEIADWTKRGPVCDILRVGQHIADDKPVMVSYCDYFMQWDYPAFRAEVLKRGCAGAVPCYSGFHPHLLPKSNLYASCKVDESDTLVEIREKFSWTEDRTLSRHSPGLYYFSSDAVMKDYAQRLVESGEDINGEYYVSLVYYAMVRDGLDVWCPVNVSKFCQWGTPEDLAEYNHWTGMMLRERIGRAR